MSDLTPQERIEVAQKRRQATRDAEANAKIEQAASDIEAITDLESEYGFDRVIAISIEGVWCPGKGAPTRVAFKVPLGSERLGQRFIEQVNRSKEGSPERIKAQDSLATECWIYPAKGSDAQKAALEIAPLLLSNAALQIVRASEGKAEEAGKE